MDILMVMIYGVMAVAVIADAGLGGVELLGK